MKRPRKKLFLKLNTQVVLNDAQLLQSSRQMTSDSRRTSKKLMKYSELQK